MIEQFGFLRNVRKARALVLSARETLEQGTATIALHMNRLGIRKKDLVGESYIDLIGQGSTG